MFPRCYNNKPSTTGFPKIVLDTPANLKSASKAKPGSPPGFFNFKENESNVSVKSGPKVSVLRSLYQKIGRGT
jgi:hypothetical protein